MMAAGIMSEMIAAQYKFNVLFPTGRSYPERYNPKRKVAAPIRIDETLTPKEIRPRS
jgi:hypothetical protein